MDHPNDHNDKPITNAGLVLWVILIFALFFLLSVASICGCSTAPVVPVSAEDRGYMHTDSGKVVHFTCDQLPLQIVFSPEAALWAPAFVAASIYINALVSTPMFSFGSGRGLIPVAGFDIDCSKERCRAWTHTRASEKNGEVELSYVLVPNDKIRDNPDSWWVAAHELLHVLGLDDDAVGYKSVMSSSMDFTSEFPGMTAPDLQRLLALYAHCR